MSGAIREQEGAEGARTLPGRVARLGVVARFKPVHTGHAVMLEALRARAEHLLVGIGSANRYDLRNPFTALETRAMLELALAGRPGRLTFLEIPDLDDGPRWRLMVRERFGPLDLYVTANPYVRDLMTDLYPVVHPAALVPAERHVPIDGTMVRRAMARGEAWQGLVPEPVARYLEEHGLVERFRREFGLATLALEAAP